MKPPAPKPTQRSLGEEGSVEKIHGSLPENWRMALLSELVSTGDAEIQTGPFGTMLRAHAYRDAGTPVVAVKNIGENRLNHVDIPRVDSETRTRLSRYELREG